MLQPQRFDVVAATNLFGDILSDLGPACTGTIGIAPSANMNPERKFPSLFEPVHGSAPDIYGKNIANPVGQIWAGAMMLDFLTRGSGAGRDAHDAILRAIEAVLREGPRTPDLGGKASTRAGPSDRRAGGRRHLSRPHSAAGPQRRSTHIIRGPATHRPHRRSPPRRGTAGEHDNAPCHTNESIASSSAPA